jgi:stage II sporulation protein D
VSTRTRFLAGCAAAAAVLPARSRALATGGADIEAPVAAHTIRILLAAGSFAPPRQIDAWRFAWNGRTYRGIFTRARLADGSTGLINALPLDAYLYGVLSSEVSPSWPRAAQHAQAIVARTYALAKLREEREYDVVASTNDQRYAGIEAETVEGRDAVDATSGTILLYGARPARVAYSSCCGGHTADGAAVWGDARPYLRGVRDPYCAGTPAFAWAATVAYEEFERAFSVESVRGLELRYPDDSGRPQVIDVIGDRVAEVRSASFRVALGAGRVRSTLIRAVVPRSDGLLLQGNGFGHGVGFCQWGSRVMGGVGAATDQILSFYFPGTAAGFG